MHPTGIVVAGYTEEQGTPFWDMTLEQKFAASRGSIEKLHPGHGKELKNPVFCGWRRGGGNEGSGVRNYGRGTSGDHVNLGGGGPAALAGAAATAACGVARRR